MILESGPLRVVFFRQADRFAHRIEVLHEGHFIAAYESMEGSEQTASPASPPLQSLHFEERSDGCRVALLVGMAGRSHWSASVEAAPAGGRITFDVACRIQEEPTWLGSTYRIGGGNSQTPLPLEEGRVRVSPETAAVVRPNGQHLIIDAPPARGPLPCTVRWRYVISLA